MLDINKATTSPHDPNGNMFGLAHWSPLFAKRQAQSEGVFLFDEHWAIINFLRERYLEHGDPENAREILRDLEAYFTDGHGRGILYQLFPRRSGDPGLPHRGLAAPSLFQRPVFR